MLGNFMTFDARRYVMLDVVDERSDFIKDLQDPIENPLKNRGTCLLMHEVLPKSEVAEDVQSEATHVPPEIALREYYAAVGA